MGAKPSRLAGLPPPVPSAAGDAWLSRFPGSSRLGYAQGILKKLKLPLARLAGSDNICNVAFDAAKKFVGVVERQTR